MAELVIGDESGQEFTDGAHRGELVCAFGNQNQPAPPYLLGDTVLRSAYVVYDLENNQIAIAPTKYNSTESNIVAFASKGAPIPSATVAPIKTAQRHTRKPAAD